MISIATARGKTPAQSISPRRVRPARVALHAFLIVMVALWIFPLFWAIYSSLRPISDTIQHGYLSWPSGGLSLINYQNVWSQADLPYYYLNTLVIAIPGVILTLLIARVKSHRPRS